MERAETRHWEISLSGCRLAGTKPGKHVPWIGMQERDIVWVNHELEWGVLESISIRGLKLV